MKYYWINNLGMIGLPKMSYSILVCCFCLAVLETSGQVPDSVKIDSLKIIDLNTAAKADTTNPEVAKFTFKKSNQFKPIPKKALLYSIIPGGGQIYNRKWWKLPFVYGTLGTVGFFIVDNTQQYRRFRDAVRIRLDGDPDTIDEFTVDGVERITTSQLQSFRDVKRGDMEMSYIIFFIAYSLSSVEAFVDAHLQSFDVSDDLSLQIKPTFNQSTNHSPYPGLGIKLKFKPKSSLSLPVEF